MRTWPSLSARSHMFQYFPSSAYSPLPSFTIPHPVLLLPSAGLFFSSQQGRDFPATHLSFWASFPIFDCFNNNNWRLAKEVENKLGAVDPAVVIRAWWSTGHPPYECCYVTGRVGGTRLDGQPTARQIPHLYFSFLFFYGRAGRSIRFTEEAWPNPQARTSSHTQPEKMRRKNWLWPPFWPAAKGRY